MPVTTNRDLAGANDLSDNLLLRVAVREIETWLMADREALAEALGLDSSLLLSNPEDIPDPKRFLLDVVRRAPREVRQEMLVSRGAVASQGIGYNALLSRFVRERWSPIRASEHSNSLARCVARVLTLAQA